MNSLAIMALVGSITAIQLQREPLLTVTNPLEVHQRPSYSQYPIDYFVPDFGVDHEVMYTENNIKNTETA